MRKDDPRKTTSSCWGDKEIGAKKRSIAKLTKRGDSLTTLALSDGREKKKSRRVSASRGA